MHTTVQSGKETSILILLTTYNKDIFKCLLKFSGPCVFFLVFEEEEELGHIVSEER